MLPREEIVQQALALPPDDRAYIADALEQSLAHREVMSPEIATAWSQELNRRIEAYERGETAAMDFETALDHMRRTLASRRSRRTTP